MGFNSAFKGLNHRDTLTSVLVSATSMAMESDWVCKKLVSLLHSSSVVGLSLLFRNNIPYFNYDHLLSLTRNLILVHIVTKFSHVTYLIVFFHHLLCLSLFLLSVLSPSNVLTHKCINVKLSIYTPLRHVGGLEI